MRDGLGLVTRLQPQNLQTGDWTATTGEFVAHPLDHPAQRRSQAKDRVKEEAKDAKPGPDSDRCGQADGEVTVGSCALRNSPPIGALD
jgi:hypothetical protein